MARSFKAEKMKIILNSMTLLLVLGLILAFVAFFDGVKHQDFYRGFPLEKALLSLDAKPDRILFHRGYKTLLYAQLIPPGTIEYRFKQGKFVKKLYEPNKLPSEY